jgi:hypothetical protein
MDKIGQSSSRVFSVDETGITTSILQDKHQKVVSSRGKKQVAALTYVERGNLYALIMCLNAAGTI